MILQTDPVLNSVFPKMEPNGCATLLPFWTANKTNGMFINRNIIIHKLEVWIDRGWIDEEMYINKWAEIHSDLGLTVRYHGHVDPELEVDRDQFAYGYWYNPNTGFHHFTALDNMAKCPTYDPLGNSLTAAYGHIETMRLFTLL